MKKKLIAEFIGTFFLIWCGTGAIVINQQAPGNIGNLGIAITFGLVVMSLIYAFGNVSGAHFNPAVTIAFAVSKRFPLAQVVPYIIAQIAGSIIASSVLLLLFPTDATKLGATIPHGSTLQSFTMEFLLTFLLMIVIMKVALGSKETGMFAGIAIGSVVLLEALFAGPICGASMNPARSIGPAVVSAHLQQLWLYIVAPTLGAVAAVFLFNYLQPNTTNV